MPEGPKDWLALLDAVEAGDPEATLELTRIVTSFLARSGAYGVRDAWDDLCQDVLMSLVASHRAGRLEADRGFLGYVGTTTRNALVDWYRRNGRNPIPVDPLPEPAVWTGQLEVDLALALEKLPEREKALVEAVYVLGYTYDEASERTGIPLGTAKRLLRRGLANLRQELDLGP